MEWKVEKRVQGKEFKKELNFFNYFKTKRGIYRTTGGLRGQRVSSQSAGLIK